METAPRIGFVGLGNMGFPMAGRLAEAGFAMSVNDLSPEVQQRFVEKHGASSAGSPAAAARNCELVITMLPDGKAVQRVVLGDNREAGMAEVMAPGSILLDMSSSAPLGTVQLGEALKERGIHLVDAPVSGGVPKAKDGTLAIIAGGDSAVVQRCRPVFDVLGGRIFHSGPLGSGHAVKALNNMLSAAGLIAAAEVLLVGRRFGVEPTVMNDILNASTGRNNSTENKMERYVFSRSFSSGFSLDLMVKDLTTAADLSRELGVPAVLSQTCRELWAAARASLTKGADHTDVVRFFEQLAGVRLEKRGVDDE
ncbi:MAG: NAD(P)-dependent oxidoreductase [Desulfobacteraceae bacterium]|nr:MAG: NAD(P)-dependent oxidoreductase [Desulfobacteraceae bacterium]